MSVLEAGLERETTGTTENSLKVRLLTVAKETDIGDAGICKADYEALASFRFLLRRFLRVTEETARAAGLTPQQHQLLLAIKGQPNRDSSSITELARSMQLRHHAVGGLVDRSEAAGLVCRTTDPADRRVVRVALTENGEKMMSALSQRNLAELDILRHALRVPAFAETATTPLQELTGDNAPFPVGFSNGNAE